MEPHLFIGIPANAELKNESLKLQESINAEKYFKRVTDPEDLHLTLLFFGGFPKDSAERIWSEIKCLSLPIPFDLYFNNVNVFGHPEKPRVVYFEPEHQKKLFELKNIVDQASKMENFPLSSIVFNPHVTIMKKWRDTNLALSDEIVFPRAFESSVCMTADRICLYRIHPDQKPSYEIVDEIRGSR